MASDDDTDYQVASATPAEFSADFNPDLNADLNAGFNDLYLLAPIGYFVIGFDTAILQMNVVGASMLGVSRANPDHYTFRQFVAPRFVDDFDHFLRRALNSSQAECCDLQLARLRHQHDVQVTLRASADSSGQAVRLVMEPAEGKLAALERSEARFRRIVHCAEEGIWEIDADARTSFVNPKMAAMLGYSIEEMLDQPLVAFMDDEGRAVLERNIARRQQGVAERREFKFLRRDGSGIWVTLATNPIFDAGGSYLGALALVADITVSRSSAELAWERASFDALTALPNRHMLVDRLNQEVKKVRREGALLALLFINLDGFKQINDTLGRDQGDALLVEAARRMVDCVRASDTVARLGGDEFVVILSGLDHAIGADRTAQTMLGLLGRRFGAQADQPSISASIGISLFLSDAATPEELLSNAGQAMSAAKQGGGNRYSYFTAELQAAAQARQQCTLDLRTALLEQQFELHYQAIVTLANGKIERAEALLRWRHPQRGLLSPGDFLPSAESGGMMMDIADWVFREAAQQARRWQDELGAGFQVGVNQSAMQFRGDTALYVGWLDYLAELGLPPRSVVIEVGEGVLLDGTEQVAHRLRDLREMGLQVALDNFGTGYSSLAHLKHFGIDLLKLDRSFIAQLASDSGALALCEALIVMAHKLGLQVVAEGVESPAQSALLALAGCDFAQGFVFARPLAAKKFSELAQQGLPRLDHAGF